MMINDLRREWKLLGFFDQEVYDILNGGGGEVGGVLSLELAPAASEVPKVLFDSGRSAATDNGQSAH